MDLPNFKDILQKLSVFKNKSLLIPVVIGLVSVLLFIPTQLMSSGLRKKVQTESISNGLSRVRSLSNNAVSDELLETKTRQLQIRANDANEIARLAIQTTQRQFLSDDIFDVNDPNSLSGLIFLQFGQRYTDGIDKLIANANARDCPTKAELTRAIEESGASSRSRLGRTGMFDSRMETPGTPAPSRNPRSGYGMRPLGGIRVRGELERLVVEQICQKRAESISFYVNPIELSGYELWKEYDINIQKVQAVEDCWYYQLAYWIIEDVIKTIDSMNSGYDNAVNSPVKRLMNVSFSMDAYGASRRTRSSRGRSSRKTDSTDENRPKYVISSDNETLLTETCTGRYSNDDIDVIHFNVVCVVSIKDIMAFMKEMCSAKEHKYIDESGQTHTYMHNQITIMETKLTSVDKESTDHNTYRYGDEGVVELDLICEYIFKKKGYEDFKPESVKETLLTEE